MEDEKFSRESSVSLHIGGISVEFPVRPYPSQLSMMSMIIRGLEKRQHCLLESPTGSGKSLALLCSALAWQRAQYEKSEAEHLGLKAECVGNDQPCTCGISTVPKDEPSTSKYFGGNEVHSANSVINLCSSDEEEDFKKPGKCTAENKPPACSSCASQEISCSSGEKESKKLTRIPKIWFGTRTHRQIAQITKELGRTSYDMTKMTILSSRQHSCIHPVVMKSSNKNEECRDLRNGTHSLGVKCAFYQNVHRMKNHHQLSCAGMGSAWDLEELVGLGKTIKSCPFYSARELVSSSNIIFCPYNYLIDPMIRSQMQINLNNQIVILDEAHNIEDSAREAGSFTMDEDSLANTTADLEYLISDGVKVDDHRPLHLLCTRLGQWINEHSRNLRTSDYETASEVWYGRSIITHLNEWGITQDTLPLLQVNFTAATDLGEEDIEIAKILHSSSQTTLGGLFNVLRYLMNDNYKYCDDYRITIIRQFAFGTMPPKRTRDGWVTLQKKPRKHFIINLHFWCLNPAVAFSDLCKAHSIILTSGTLSPMSSFSSELGLSFPIQLEANHVIRDSQVWVGSIGKGPKGIQLEATYKNTDRFAFQDELGELVCQVCRIVPHGVLCFFSSYSMMLKLQERWKTTGLWHKIEELKVPVCEPRSSSKDEFDSLLQSFYDAVKESETTVLPSGALLLAVCRGKVSEGLDFADNNARAVITVGIPFPSIKDKKVELKRKYNDMHKKERGLLSGAQWYEIQAFRAMNQALGRCIRHRTDWGALIIVDERFCKNPRKYTAGLSKWVRQKVVPYPSYGAAISSIEAFMQGWTSKHGSLAVNSSGQPEQNSDARPLCNITSIGFHCTNATCKPSTSQEDEDERGKEAKISEAKTSDQSCEVVISVDCQQPKLSESSLSKKLKQKLGKMEINSASLAKGESDDIVEDNFESKKLISSMQFQKELLNLSSCRNVCDENSKNTTGTLGRMAESALSKVQPRKSKRLVEKAKPLTFREQDFSGDEIDLSPDADFQIPFSKTQKERKLLEKARKNDILRIDADSQPAAENVDDGDDNFLEDLFDCTIPATPEKSNLTIIPESPASTRKELPQCAAVADNGKARQALDFFMHSDVSKLSKKRKISHSLVHLSPPLSKRTEEDSGELLPKTKRKTRLKNIKKTKCLGIEGELKCEACGNSFVATTPLLKVEIESIYLSSLVNQNKGCMCDVYAVDADAVIAGSVFIFSAGEVDGVRTELNSHWSNKDGKCYQVIKCSKCSAVVASRIVSDSAMENKRLFFTNLVLRD